MRNYIASPLVVFAFTCLAGLCTLVDSRAETLQSSGGNFVSVQAAVIDENENSLTLLVGSGPELVPADKSVLSIVNVSQFDRKIDQEIEIGRSIRMSLPPVFYSDIEKGEYLIAHNSRSGIIIRWLDATGHQWDKQVAPFAEHAVVGIAKPGQRVRIVTSNGIYELNEDRSWQKIFAVVDSEAIVSSLAIDDGECGHTIVVVRADNTSWNVQLLCNSQGKLVAKYNMPGPSNIAPGIQTKVLRVSLKSATVWVAGLGEEAGVSFAECRFTNQPACVTSPLEVGFAGYPLVATHLPIAMISDSLVAVVHSENDTVNLALHKLDGRKVHEQELDLASARITDEYVSRVMGVDVLGSEDRIWVVAQIGSVFSGSHEIPDGRKLIIDVGFDAFYYDEESEALVPIRSTE